MVHVDVLKLSPRIKQTTFSEIIKITTGAQARGLSTDRSAETEDIIVFTDAAWRESSQQAGLCWLFSGRLANSTVWFTKTEEFVPSPLMAEGLAIREALLSAIQMGYTNLSVKSDAQTIVRAINNKNSLKELFGVFHDILNLSLEFSAISFIYIPRSDNSAADALAKGALTAVAM